MQFMTWQRVTEVINAIFFWGGGGVIIFITLQTMNSYDCTIVLMQATKAYGKVEVEVELYTFLTLTLNFMPHPLYLWRKEPQILIY